MKALLLAAGYGTRMRPITNLLAKASVPVGNKALILGLVDLLASAGVNTIVVNTHHLGASVVKTLSDHGMPGVTIQFSNEPVLLGTGGGLAATRPFFCDEEAFLAINAELVCDVDLRSIVAAHRTSEADATMVVCEHSGDPSLGWVGVDPDGWVNRVPDLPQPFKPTRRLSFTGIHVLTPSIFDYLTETGPACILRDGYVRMMQDGGRVRAFHVGPNDVMEVGSPSQLLRANWRFLDGLAARMDYQPTLCADIVPPVLIGAGVRMGRRVRLGPYTVVGERVVLEDDVAARYSVILPDAYVSSRTRLHAAVHFGRETIYSEDL